MCNIGKLTATCLLACVAVACSRVNQTSTKTLQHCDRLEIWKAVLISSTFARQTSDVIKHETGRDEFGPIYEEKLAPTLKRYGIDRTEAVLIFEEEGGWPYDPPSTRPCGPSK